MKSMKTYRTKLETQLKTSIKNSLQMMCMC